MHAASYQPHELSKREQDLRAARLELLAYAKMAETVGMALRR